MLLSTCLGTLGLALLCVIFVHLRKNKRVSGGVVLAAAMLTFQAIINPPTQQFIAQLEEDQQKEETDPVTEASLESQIRRQAKRIRLGHERTDLTLRLPSRKP